MNQADSEPEKNASKTADPAVELFAQRFVLIEELGRGGFATVYRAKEVLLDREVAIKILNTKFLGESANLQRFQQEARACSGLQHPNIVQVLFYGVDETTPYIVMEYLPGKTLEKMLQESPGLNREQFQKLFIPVLDALAYAHSKNIIHRDIKPGNLILSQEDDGSQTVKVLDFGIAKVIESDDNTNTNATIGLTGSPLYMSPEQCAGGKIDRRSDIYSLACVMYESIVGKPPFTGETALETMYEHLKTSVPKLVEISGSLNIPKSLFEVIISGLSKEPEKRPQTMQTFKEQILVSLCDSDSIKGSKTRSKPQPVLVLTGVLGLLLLVPSWNMIKQSSFGPKPIFIPRKDYRGLHPLSSVNDMNLLQQAHNLRDSGKAKEALSLCLEGLKIASKQEKKEWIMQAHLELARTYNALNDFDHAYSEYRLALNVYSYPTAASRLYCIGETSTWLMDQGRNDEAIELNRTALKACKAELKGEPDKAVAEAYSGFAQLLLRIKKYKESMENAKLSLDLFDQLPEERYNPHAITTVFNYYDAAMALGKRDLALEEIKHTSALLSQLKHIDQESFFLFARSCYQRGLKSESLPFFYLSIKYISEAEPKNESSILDECHKAIADIEKSN